LAAEIERLRRRLAESEAELERLGRWLESLYFDLEAVLASRRFRWGEAILERGLKRLLRRANRGQAWAPDHARELMRDYERWRRRRQPERPGPGETRPGPLGALGAAAAEGALDVDVVLCVRDALADLERCLSALAPDLNRLGRLIIVNDGSEAATTQYLRAFAEGRPGVALIENPEPGGYTRAANQGLAAAGAGHVILLNSDATPTPGWIEGLLECARSRPRIGLVGPISNAAAWQSVPRPQDLNGDWAVNELPPGLGPEEMGGLLRRLSERRFPAVPYLNGFCLMIDRRVLETVGLFDEQAFPHGYGEEQDYCLRTAAAGFELAVADHVYVHHAKSRSYGYVDRWRLTRVGWKTLERRYGRRRLRALDRLWREEPTLGALRGRVREEFDRLRTE